MARFFLTLILFCLITISSFGANKWAIVITIGNYPDATGWSDISSDRDKQIIAELLIDQQFPESNITFLSEKDATPQGVKTAFESLLLRLSDGDIIYFHFSGHGQQIQDVASSAQYAEALHTDEDDGWDEALALYNAPESFYAGYNFQEHLVDDQIGEYFNSILRKIGGEGQLIAVFDSCHSGTVSRGSSDWKVRGSSKKCAPIDYKPTLSQGDNPARDFEYDNTPETGKLFCFFGCRANQVNREYNDAGSLTVFFAKALNMLGANATYNNLFSFVNEEMAINFNNEQQPLAEGTDMNLRIFSGEFVAQDRFFDCTKLDGIWAEINAGSLHGLALGDTIGFYGNTINQIKDAVPVYKGVVSDLSLLEAQVVLPTKVKERPEKFRLFVVARAFQETKLNVLLDAGDLNDEITQLLKDSKVVSLVQGKAGYSIRKLKGTSREKKIQIMVGTDSSAFPFKNMEWLDLESQGGRDSVELLFHMLARIDAIRKLEMVDGNLEVELHVRKGVISPASKKKCVCNDQDFEGLPVLTSTGTDCFDLQFENRSKFPVYLSIIDIKPNGEMQVAIPSMRIETSNVKSIANLRADGIAPFGMECIKWLVTESPVDIRGLDALGASLATTRGNSNVLYDILKQTLEGKRCTISTEEGMAMGTLFLMTLD